VQGGPTTISGFPSPSSKRRTYIQGGSLYSAASELNTGVRLKIFARSSSANKVHKEGKIAQSGSEGMAGKLQSNPTLVSEKGRTEIGWGARKASLKAIKEKTLTNVCYEVARKDCGIKLNFLLRRGRNAL